MATWIPTGYGPRIVKLFFDGDEFKYELWEVKFLGYLRIQHLYQIILSPTDQSGDMDFVEKNTTIFAVLIQYLDNKSLSLVIRDRKDNGRKDLRIFIIIIIMSCYRHGYPWPFLATSPYCSSLPAGSQERKPKVISLYTELSIIWKSDLTDKMKRSFFQAAVTSILLYGCTTWTLTKRLEKKLDGNYTRMLRAILNKSWQQHPTRHQLYGHLPPSRKLFKLDEPDMQDIAGEAEMNS